MGITVNTNIQSVFAQRALSLNTGKLQKATERLSTGFRINRASDDAAGLSISEKLTSRIKGFEKAEQNAGDGISLIQTAEGGLAVIQDNLQRIRELMVQALNGTNGNDELDAIQREINAAVQTVDDIGAATQFNNVQLITGATDITLQTGPNAADTTVIQLATGTTGVGIDVDITLASVDGSMTEGVTFALDALHVGGSGNVTATDAATTTANGDLAGVDSMINNISRMRSYLGSVQNSLESKIEFLGVARENASASRSRIKDVDVAKESSELIKFQILQQSASAMLSQANAQPQVALSLLPG